MRVKVESVNCELNQGCCFNDIYYARVHPAGYVPVTTDYTIKVNVDGYDPFAGDTIKAAIESLNNRPNYIFGGRGNGKTRMCYDYLTGRIDWRKELEKEYAKFDIRDVIFNDPATIVIWADGTKTVVKAENEPFDPEKGLAMAISKRALGNKYDYYDTFKKYVGRYEKKQKKG